LYCIGLRRAFTMQTVGLRRGLSSACRLAVVRDYRRSLSAGASV